MNRCPTCKDWVFQSISHRCPPAFVCQPIGDYADYGEPETVHAFDAEEAGKKFAETWDCEMEHPLMRGNELLLRVTDKDGKAVKCIVTGETVPAYYCHEVRERGEPASARRESTDAESGRG